jgi:hypothetical protein
MSEINKAQCHDAPQTEAEAEARLQAFFERMSDTTHMVLITTDEDGNEVEVPIGEVKED